MIIIHYYTKEVNICEFNYDCDIRNDTLIPSKMYFKLINMDCPSYRNYDYIYKIAYVNNGGTSYDLNCMTSEFGCCRYNTQCANSLAIHDYNMWSRFSNLDLYNHYIEDDIGYTDTFIYKENKEGTNCPSIEYILLQISLINNNDNSLIFLAMIYVYVLSLIVYGLYVYIRKPTQKYSDVESQAIQASA